MAAHQNRWLNRQRLNRFCLNVIAIRSDLVERRADVAKQKTDLLLIFVICEHVLFVAQFVYYSPVARVLAGFSHFYFPFSANDEARGKIKTYAFTRRRDEELAECRDGGGRGGGESGTCARFTTGRSHCDRPLRA